MPRFEYNFTPEELATEIWKPVIEWEDAYSVSSLGRVRRDRSGQGTQAGYILKPAIQNNTNWKYPRLSLYREGEGRGYTVHSLVARAFLGPCPKGMEVTHKDSDPTNPRASNLEYKTHQANLQQAIDEGRWPTGERHYTKRAPHLLCRGEKRPQSVLTDDLVRQARKLRKEGITQRVVAEKLGVSRSLISSIDTGRTWSHVN